ncbi:MAG: glycosyltransferase, partial [Candidatus Micrarchaeota archaeon]|nr:glycosyltransferase [Candidatus Micrarchaeota archaeon]
NNTSPFSFEYALCFANWKYHKGVDIVLNSLESWKNDLRLVMIGNKPKPYEVPEKILKKIEENLKKGRIIFTGRVSDHQLATYYRFAKVFLHPSREEGFGLPPLEAIACGTNVISADIEVSKEVLKNAALYFRSGDPDSLTECLEKFLNSKSLQEELSSFAKEVLRQYSWEETAKKTFQVYKSLI